MTGQDRAVARDLGPGAIAVMILLCTSWALQQVAVKLAMADIPPLIQATLRSVGALIVIVGIATWRGQRLFAKDGTLLAGLCAGTLFAAEFILVFHSLTFTSASRAVVFLYTAPFFIALGARRFLGETMTALQWSGLGLSFTGVALAIGVPQPSVDISTMIGDVMSLGGGIAWAATTLVVKSSRLRTVTAEKTMVYQLTVSIPFLGIAAWLLNERMIAMPGLLATSSLLFQAVWVVGITFLVWYMLIKTYSASKLSAFTFLTPLLGVAAGVVILNEPMSPVFALAALLVIAGLYLVNKPQKQG